MKKLLAVALASVLSFSATASNTTESDNDLVLYCHDYTNIATEILAAHQSGSDVIQMLQEQVDAGDEYAAQPWVQELFFAASIIPVFEDEELNNQMMLDYENAIFVGCIDQQSANQ